MNSAVAGRLRLIDFLLEKYGYINRDALMDYYGLSMPQASLDIQQYLESAPDNMAYNKSAKRYERTAAFMRKFP